MNPWINYHHLYYFKAIAEVGSVSRAAEKLRIGQPTLSAQLKLFEETLGIPLFERQHKKLILTEQGRVALDYARSIFEMGSEMYEVLHDRIKPMKTSLHLGALDSIPKQIILQIVKQAVQVGPCQITLSEGRPDELLRELSAHRVDLLLSNFLPAGVDAKGLNPRRLSRKNVAFYGAPIFKKLRKNFPESLTGQPVILPTYDSKLRQDLEHWARLQEVKWDILTESQDISVKKLLATHGLGIMAAATHAVTRQVHEGALVEIGVLQGVYEELFLITAHRKMENPIAAALMKDFSLENSPR